jgi:hypothetical protein
MNELTKILKRYGITGIYPAAELLPIATDEEEPINSPEKRLLKPATLSAD